MVSPKNESNLQQSENTKGHIRNNPSTKIFLTPPASILCVTNYGHVNRCAGILTLNVDKNLAHPRHGHLWSPYSGKIFAAATLHYEIDTRTWQSIASICCRYKLKRIFSDAVSSLTGVLKSTQRNNMSPSSEKTSVFRICCWQSARNTSFKLSVLSMGSRP